MSSPQINFPLCTIAHTPRLPEHCIEWVRLLLWPKENPFSEETPIDGDDPHHLSWIFEKAQKRAAEFGTYISCCFVSVYHSRHYFILFLLVNPVLSFIATFHSLQHTIFHQQTVFLVTCYLALLFSPRNHWSVQLVPYPWPSHRHHWGDLQADTGSGEENHPCCSLH